ncbi:hypothetical protein ASF41_23340 [Methylobacterium sp. Leaf111]|uniref:hypothetical protein n=1 Tax=Methylobacterium sp. Leaf111 TaxID=1736257 RepID=UPI0006F22D8F|nr:hypothetical protein [Methylobacterium sp. Leaf111]KQP53609.1 hypothetical protein ASF41_23340 [Methylobacterium sp. Leaf111]
MLYLCFALLGAAASRTFTVRGLLILVSVLAVAIGLEGALSHRPLPSVLLSAVLMLVAVEVSYLTTALLWDEKARSLSYWKV